MNGTSRRPIATLVLAGLVIAAAVVLLVSPPVGGGAGTPDADGLLEVVIEEYRFEPGRLVLPAGQQVTLRFENRDSVAHHISMGRDILIEDDREVGFTQDLLAGSVRRVDPDRALLTGMIATTIDVQPGEVVRVDVLLDAEDRGDWLLGCFTGQGCHHRAGLQGEVTVE